MAGLNPKTPHKANPATTPPRLPSSNRASKVRVIARVRPFLAREIASKKGEFAVPCCVSMLNSESLSPSSQENEVSVHLKDPETRRNEVYKLDAFFGQDDHNVAGIFDKEVSPLIPGIFQGFNATVFAYGATGSGKTYTMQGTDEQPGLMVQAMSRILSICDSTGSKAEISYYEVYLDRCYDLLELKANEVVVLEDKDGEVHMRGLSHVPVSSMAEFQEVFSCGTRRRKVALTGLNDASSRSHGVLVIAVSSCPTNSSSSTISGKLNLIDLAGNEDNRWTSNEGIRLQESSKINQSLFALSNVIYALNNNQPRVPYRESKLTRILQDSLGGTSRALMVTCLNPGEYQESVRTVSLAARSRQITNFVPSASEHGTPKDKVDMETKLRDWLESRGKTKSAHRMGAFVSPNYTRTPATKKQPSIHGSAMSKSTVNGRLKSVPQRKLFSCDIALNSDASGNESQGEEENDDYSTLPGSVYQSSNCDDSEISMAQSVKEKGEGNEHACFECMVELQACLPDGKSKDMLTMKQDKQEWLEYRNVMDNVVKRSGLNKGVFYDLRGNHDSFGVPFVGGSYDFYSNYSLNALLGRPGKVNSVTLQTEERRHVFVGIDSSMAVGLRGPTNLFGHPTDKLLADMDSELSQWNSDPTKPVTKISFGHFPISFSAASESGKTLKDVLLKQSVSAYLCGHLHASFGENLKRLHRSGNNLVQINMHGSPSGRQNCSPGAPPIQEFWEWEMGDWRKNRAMRIVAIDKGHVSFFDMDFKSGAKKTIVLPTFPLDSRMMWTASSLHDYECRTTDPLLLSTIRALVFSVSPIASVVARIYDSSPGELALVMEDLMKKHEDDQGVLYTAVWNYNAFEDPSAVRYWIQIEAIDKLGRSTLSELRPFSVNGRTKELSWTWKVVMVMGCQWAAIYIPFLWISLGFCVLILVMIISLSLPIVIKNWQSLLADRGFIKAGRVMSELQRLNVVWFGMLVYVFYLMIFPWFSGQVFTGGGQRSYLTHKGWNVKSPETNGNVDFAGFPDVMVVVLPHIFFVVVPSILVALSLAVEREMYRLRVLSFSRKKKDDQNSKNEEKKIRSGFHMASRWIRKLLMLIGLAIFLKHYKSCRAMSRAFEMNPLLHFPGYTLVMPLLLVYACYETRRI